MTWLKTFHGLFKIFPWKIFVALFHLADKINTSCHQLDCCLDGCKPWVTHVALLFAINMASIAGDLHESNCTSSGCSQAVVVCFLFHQLLSFLELHPNHASSWWIADDLNFNAKWLRLLYNVYKMWKANRFCCPWMKSKNALVETLPCRCSNCFDPWFVEFIDETWNTPPETLLFSVFIRH